VYFLTYDESYLKESQTPERYIDVIRRLEREVFGDAKLVYPRVAQVKVGNIVNLKAHFAEYETNKKEFVKIMANNLEENMWALLHAMRHPGNKT
jgi:hypothetical protein